MYAQNMAGQGNTVGGSFEHLKAIIGELQHVYGWSAWRVWRHTCMSYMLMCDAHVLAVADQVHDKSRVG